MNYQENYQRWLTCPKVDEATKEALRAMSHDEDTIKFNFFQYLSFGTAGLRGTMAPGTNNMNVYTVAHATQGLANLIIQTGKEAMQRGVVIAYDCRINSKLFAETTASVLAANGINVYLFDALRPTPLLSYSVRALHCIAGVNITASHNPKEYNGYKAYWEDGAQISPALAKVISAEIAKTDIFEDVKTIPLQQAIDQGTIKMVGEELDRTYLNEVQKQLVHPENIANGEKKLHIVYTPLHGTGYRLVPQILKRVGFENVSFVDEQMVIDGRFPTVDFPNPEYREVFTLGIKKAEQIGSDLIVATDPDADRVGVVTKAANGEFVTITGNQMGALLLDYIITQLRAQDRLPDHAYAIKSIVTTEMATKICEQNNVTMYSVFTGFKNIGEKMYEMEQAGNHGFLFGYEESYGYLRGNYARDKDAVVATMLICEMASYYATQNKTLYDALQGLYEKYGYYLDRQENIYMKGLSGLERMKQLMAALRNEPPKQIGGIAVVCVTDYLTKQTTDLQSGKTTSTNMESTDVLSYRTAAGDTVVIRPSGTEPKIKIYFLVSGTDETRAAQKSDAYRSTALQWVDTLAPDPSEHKKETNEDPNA